MRKFTVIVNKEPEGYAVFRKRLIGKKRLTPGSFPTLEVAIDYGMSLMDEHPDKSCSMDIKV